MTEQQLQSAAEAIAQLLYGDIGRDHPSWESCVELADVALRAAEAAA